METNTRKIERRLKRERWYLVRHGSNHDIYEHPDGRQIAIPRHTTIGARLARKIAKHAGW